MNYTVNFTAAELNIVILALAEIQYKHAAPVIKRIEKAMNEAKKAVEEVTQGKEPITFGDTVILNSGGPEMKVLDIDDENGDLECVWESGDLAHCHTFPPESVTLVKKKHNLGK